MNFSNLNPNFSNSLDLRNLQEQVKKAFSLEFQKFFSVTRTIFLTVCQNNFGNKIPFPLLLPMQGQDYFLAHLVAYELLKNCVNNIKFSAFLPYPMAKNSYWQVWLTLFRVNMFRLVYIFYFYFLGAKSVFNFGRFWPTSASVIMNICPHSQRLVRFGIFLQVQVILEEINA